MLHTSRIDIQQFPPNLVDIYPGQNVREQQHGKNHDVTCIDARPSLEPSKLNATSKKLPLEASQCWKACHKNDPHNPKQPNAIGIRNAVKPPRARQRGSDEGPHQPVPYLKTHR